MKKVIAVLLAALLMLSLFAACSSSQTASAPAAAPSSAASSSAPFAAKANDNGTTAEAAEPQKASGGTGSSVLNGVSTAVPPAQKMIFTASADIETTKFDDTISGVYAMLNTYGAFIENSSVGGRNYADTFYGNQPARTANFTIRVPAQQFSSMTMNLSTLGNVVSSSTQSQNITVQYIDTESRLKACRAEETSLLAMLEKAATVEVMLTIESRLTDVRYEIESLTSTLKNWQNQVDYSTVALTIREVAVLTEKQPPVQRTYWEEVRDGFNATLQGIGDFFKGLFKVIVIALPVLVILAVIAVVVIVILRARVRKKQSKQDSTNIPKE